MPVQPENVLHYVEKTGHLLVRNYILELGEYVVPAGRFIEQREQRTRRAGIAGMQLPSSKVI
jgi:hypothetical protein